MNDKHKITDDKKKTESNAPYVNEKVKYCIFVAVVILCIIAALAVVFSPEAKERRKKQYEKPKSVALLVQSRSNT